MRHMPATPRVRMSPARRREQLLDLGVTAARHPVAGRALDRDPRRGGRHLAGLLYHYFGNKHDFHEAVVRRAADDLIATTAPPAEGDPLDRLLASVAAYVDYVEANYQGYLSLVKGAAGGNEAIRDIYEEARAALTDRIFREDAQGTVVPDTPAARLMVRGWSAMAEDLVLSWVREPDGVTREELLGALAASLPALVEILH